MSFGNRTPVKSTALTAKSGTAGAIERVLIKGDLSGLSEDQRLSYAKDLAKAAGISLLYQPFEYLTLNGRLVLYVRRTATEQLRKRDKISIKIVSREKVGDLYVVTVEATNKSGQTDGAIGAVCFTGLRGTELANAMMKAETKAKRRVTLSICGLGMLDESEALDVAEREAKEAAQIASDVVETKLNETSQRPEFESMNATSAEAPASPHPADTTETDYRMKSGANKNKLLRDISLKKLKDWLKWYNEITATGKFALDAAVQDDAFNIKAFLDGLEAPE